jgi:hypothetical protein
MVAMDRSGLYDHLLPAPSRAAANPNIATKRAE